MKKLILLAALTAMASASFAQFNITKRKHLKGYQLEWIKKESKVQKTNTEAADVNSFKEEEPVSNPSLVNQEVHQVASSPELSFSEELNLPASGAWTSNSTSNSESLKKDQHKELSASTSTSLKSRAVKHVLNKAIKKAEKVQQKINKTGGGNNATTFGYVGFGLAILAMMGFFGAGLLVLLSLPGLIFSIMGLNSDSHIFAMLGLILNSVLLFALLIAIILVASFFAGI